MSNNNLESIKLNPWKIEFREDGFGPVASLVKVADLLNSNGCSLSHDLIVYNREIYNEAGSFIIEAENAPTRGKFGIFLVRALFDRRVLNLRGISWKTDNRYNQNISYLKLNSTTANGYWENVPKEAYIYPPSDLFFGSSSTSTSIYHTVDKSNLIYHYQSAPEAQDYWRGGPSVLFESSSNEELGSDLIISSQDLILQSSLSNTDLSNGRKIRINKNIINSASLVSFLTGIDQNIVSPDLILDPNENLALHHTYVWVVCSFFGDYIKSSNFNQDLHPYANSKYQNLIVGFGDFKRFGEKTKEEPIELDEINVNTDTAVPYLPQTPPRLNLIPKNFAGPLILSSQEGEVTVTGTNPESENIHYPKGWFDPSILTGTQQEYEMKIQEKLNNRLVPSALIGNGYFLGRLFSPTIDEIWQYLKLITSARNTNSNSEPGPKGQDAGTKILPAELMMTLQGSLKGDPLTADGSEFIDKPNKIVYRLKESITTLLTMLIANSDYTTYQPFPETVVETVEGETLPLEKQPFAVRANPYSLRELEAELKNLLFQLETFVAYLTIQKVTIGSSEETDSGTLYQLHKNYISSTRTLDKRSLPTNTKWTNKDKTKPNDLNAPDYANRSINYDNHQKEDVYLSAEGEWRYLFDEVVLPIVNEDD